MPKTKKKQKVIQKEIGTGALKNKSAKKKSVKKAPAKKALPKKKSSKKTGSKKSSEKKKVVKAKTAVKEDSDTLAASHIVIETDETASIKHVKHDKDTESVIDESEVSAERLSKNDGEPTTVKSVPPPVISGRRHAERRGIRSPLLYFSLLLLGSALFAGYWINEYGQNDNGRNIALSEKIESVLSQSLNSVREAVGVERNGIETDLAKESELLSVTDTSEVDPVAVLSGVVDTGVIISEPIIDSEDLPVMGTPVTAENLEKGGTEKIQLETPVLTQSDPVVEVENESVNSVEATAVSNEVNSVEAATRSNIVNNNATSESLNEHYRQTDRPQSPYYYQGLVPEFRAPLPIDHYRQPSPPATRSYKQVAPVMMPRVYPGYGYMLMPYPPYYGPHPYYPVYRQAPLTQPGQQNSEIQ